jgi:chemotaxis signal transduction protein
MEKTIDQSGPDSQIGLSEEKFLFCQDRKNLLAIPVEQIVEVVLSSRISALPKKTKHLIGATNLRGEVLPVLDIDSLLEESSANETSVQRKYAVILSISGEKFALQIERVRRIVSLNQSCFSGENTADFAHGSTMVSRIAKTKDGNVLILDLNHTLKLSNTLNTSNGAGDE